MYAVPWVAVILSYLTDNILILLALYILLPTAIGLGITAYAKNHALPHLDGQVLVSGNEGEKLRLVT